MKCEFDFSKYGTESPLMIFAEALAGQGLCASPSEHGATFSPDPYKQKSYALRTDGCGGKTSIAFEAGGKAAEISVKDAHGFLLNVSAREQDNGLYIDSMQIRLGKDCPIYDLMATDEVMLLLLDGVSDFSQSLYAQTKPSVGEPLKAVDFMQKAVTNNPQTRNLKVFQIIARNSRTSTAGFNKKPPQFRPK